MFVYFLVFCLIHPLKVLLYLFLMNFHNRVNLYAFIFLQFSFHIFVLFFKIILIDCFLYSYFLRQIYPNSKF